MLEMANQQAVSESQGSTSGTHWGTPIERFANSASQLEHFAGETTSQ